MLSILIPTYNNLKYLKLCIDSIIKNSSEKHELIVHINSGGFPPTLSTKAMIVASRIMSINKTILVINNSPESYLKIRRIMNLPMDVIINFCVDIFFCFSVGLGA